MNNTSARKKVSTKTAELPEGSNEEETITPERALFDIEVDLTYIGTLLEGADYLLDELGAYFALSTDDKASLIKADFKRSGSIAEVIRALVSTMSSIVKNNIEVIDSI